MSEEPRASESGATSDIGETERSGPERGRRWPPPSPLVLLVVVLLAGRWILAGLALLSAPLGAIGLLGLGFALVNLVAALALLSMKQVAFWIAGVFCVMDLGRAVVFGLPEPALTVPSLFIILVNGFALVVLRSELRRATPPTARDQGPTARLDPLAPAYGGYVVAPPAGEADDPDAAEDPDGGDADGAPLPDDGGLEVPDELRGSDEDDALADGPPSKEQRPA